MLYKIACITFTALFALLALHAKAEQDSFELKILTEEFPPYNFSSEGRITGINIELLRLMCDRAGIVCTFEMLPWNRALRNAQNLENTGLVSTARIPSREDLFQWVGPLASGTNCLYKLRARTDLFINSLEDAAKYSLGVSSDAIFADLLVDYGFEKEKNLVLYPHKYGMVKPFAVGRVDLIVGSANTIDTQLAHAGLTLDDIMPVLTVDLSRVLGNYLAINKNTDRAVAIALQASLHELEQEKVMQKLLLTFSTNAQARAPENVDASLWNSCI